MLGFQTNTGTKSHKHTCLKYPKTDSGMISIYIYIHTHYIYILTILYYWLAFLNSWNVACFTHEAKLFWSVIVDLHNLGWQPMKWFRLWPISTEVAPWNECLGQVLLCHCGTTFLERAWHLLVWLMYRNPKNGRAVKSSGNMLKYVEFPEKKIALCWLNPPAQWWCCGRFCHGQFCSGREGEILWPCIVSLCFTVYFCLIWNTDINVYSTMQYIYTYNYINICYDII